jgi:hypothetical protein
MRGWDESHDEQKRGTKASCSTPVEVSHSNCHFFYDYTVQHRYSQRTCTHPNERTYPNPTLMSIYLRRLGRQILEIDEVTIGTSLSMGMSPTTERQTLLNPEIFTPAGSQTQDLMCYLVSCNHTRLQALSQLFNHEKIELMQFNNFVFI